MIYNPLLSRPPLPHLHLSSVKANGHFKKGLPLIHVWVTCLDGKTAIWKHTCPKDNNNQGEKRRYYIISNIKNHLLYSPLKP